MTAMTPPDVPRSRDRPGFWEALNGVGYAITWQEVDGVQTRVLTAGSPQAPPVVLLHGTGGHLEAFIHNVEAFAQVARVIAFDLPGHGWSGGPSRSYEIDGYCRHLEAFLNAFRIERATLVGQSLGGWIAIRYAADYPERVDRLVLVGPGGTASDPQVMSSLRESSIAAVSGPTVESIRRRLELVIADPGQVTDELVSCRRAIYQQPDALERMRQIMCLQDPAIRERNLLAPATLAAVESPSLVVSGDRDRVVRLAVSERLAEQLPAGRLLVMPACGHWPQFEMPELFNSEALAFIAGDRAAHARHPANLNGGP